jgi:hypothetical protein
MPHPDFIRKFLSVFAGSIVENNPRIGKVLDRLRTSVSPAVPVARATAA